MIVLAARGALAGGSPQEDYPWGQVAGKVGKAESFRATITSSSSGSGVDAPVSAG